MGEIGTPEEWLMQARANHQEAVREVIRRRKEWEAACAARNAAYEVATATAKTVERIENEEV